jgi:hypothetical protein
MEIPDFRDKAVRAKYRRDNWIQKHIDPDRIFPDDQDLSITNDFSAVAIALDRAATHVRKALDAIKAFPVAAPEDQIRIIRLVKEVRDSAPAYAVAYARARKIADAYPVSPGGRALCELLVDVGEEKRVMLTDSFVEQLNDFLLKK